MNPWDYDAITRKDKSSERTRTMLRPKLRRVAIRVAIGGCVVALAVQFIRPTLSNPSVSAEIQAPPEIRQILRNSCYDCHSNETRLAWFDRIIPAEWLVTEDVRSARRHVNFSEAGALPIAVQRGILVHALNQIQLGAMPLSTYKALHPHASITDAQVAVIRDYLNSAVLRPTTSPKVEVGEGGEHSPGTEPHIRSGRVLAALNGIEFLPEYRTWKTISSTDRPDNNTIREVLGNPVAIKAISDHHINPWPDGTILVKLAWTKQFDAKGIAHASKLNHVAFMIRDSKKYASTKNWGFAEWVGEDLKPYGKDATFTSECVDCHAPLQKTDYVYTVPIARPE